RDAVAAVLAPASMTLPSDPSPAAPAGGKGQGGQVKAAPAVNSIRVDLEKLDYLVNLVGELVISQSMLAEQLAVLPTDKFPTLPRSIEERTQHPGNLRAGGAA